MASWSQEKRLEPRKIAPKNPVRGNSPESSRDGSTGQRPSKPKREQVKVACNSCKRGKNKCDGARPQCDKCMRTDKECEYDVEPDTSRAESMRRRYDALYGEYQELKHLVDNLRSSSSSVAGELFGRLRYENKPIDVSRSLHEDTIHPHSDVATSGSQLDSSAHDIGILDEEALKAAPMQVAAKPWTLVAGNGIVSELVSTFFLYDNAFYCSFVDRECFLEDMRSGDSDQATFCSPLLVNAICALRSSTSTRARTFGEISGFNTRDRFLEEAKRLLDREFGRRSLQTVQALLIMYATLAGMGKDRAGAIYRYAAYEMLRRMKLETKFYTTAFSDEGKRSRYQKAISRALWGICCFESISAFSYLQPAMMRVPGIPRRFVDDGGVDPEVVGRSEVAKDSHVSAYVFNAFCDLSEMLLRIMELNERVGGYLEKESDVEVRMDLYQELLEFEASLSPMLRPESNFTLGTCFLGTYRNLVAFSIFRPLKSDMALPRQYGTPAKVLYHHCKLNVESCERYWNQWPSSDYSVHSVYPLYACAITLIHQLRDENTHDLFGRTCVLLGRHAEDFPFVSSLSHCLNAIMQCSGYPTPPAAARYLAGRHVPMEDLQDVAVSFIVPMHNMSGLISREEDSEGVELGTLIKELSAFELSR